jgi:glycosyltransferase involved in cell wall biosynthesis
MPENNVDLALDAFERQGWPIPVVVVGAANYDAPIARRVAQLDAANKIKWLGHVDNQELLTALWANAALYVHGHSVGGTNPALLQALGAGAPTIALDTPFNREVLADDDTLYDACPDALGATALSLIDDRERRDRARHRGRAIVADRYRWDDVCNAYLSLLSGLATVRRER